MVGITLMRLHRAWLLQSVTLPHIIAAEIEQRKRMEMIAAIGRIGSSSSATDPFSQANVAVPPATTPRDLTDRAEAGTMEREVS